MSFAVTLDPPAVAANRTELDLMSGSLLTDQRGIDWGDAAVAAAMANEQQWGSSPVSYRVANRQVTIPLMVSTDDDATYDAAWQALRQKVATFQREGGWIKRDTGKGSPSYADVVNATLRAPDQYGGVADFEPNVELVLECLPDFYGDLVTLDTINVTAGDYSGVLTDGGAPAVIQGDHPGRAQLAVSDASNHDEFGIIWGFRSRHYDAAASADLTWTASDLSLASGASLSADSATHTGSAIKKAGTGAWADIAYLNGSHVGSYQVWARMRTDVAGVYAQNQWSIGDTGQLISGDYIPLTVSVNNQGGLIGWPALAAPTAYYYMVNLGQVRLDTYPAGGQKWRAAIRALIPNGGNVYLDSVMLQPLDEAAGAARGVYSSDAAIVSGSRALLRYDGILRATSSGQAFKPMAEVYGDLPRIPPAGLEGRSVELLMKVSRGDLGSNPDLALSSFSVTPAYRPTYLFRP